jgi:hypothetical protein
MRFPPLILRLSISKPGHHGRTVLWLPIFLAWLFLLALFLALLPLILLAALVALFFGWGKAVLGFFPLVGNCICHLHGLEVDVADKDHVVFVSFK